jgi:hypothetical protein
MAARSILERSISAWKLSKCTSTKHYTETDAIPLFYFIPSLFLIFSHTNLIFAETGLIFEL